MAKLIKNQNAKRSAKPTRRRATTSSSYSGPKNPLLPSSLNNNMTVDSSSKSFRMVGTEYAGQPRNLTGNETPGQILFNTLVTAASCPRLAAMSRCWQRYTVNKLSAVLVTLNGAVVQSGYTMAYIDDPAYPIRSDAKGIVNLTAFAGSTVRQNWVMSSVDNTTRNGQKPPLFVTTTGDIRLYSPGRIVVQLNGTPANTPNTTVTWALMLKYDITFHHPGVDSDLASPDFDTVWSNNININLQPTGPGLNSSASPQGLLPNTNYYAATPVPTAVVVASQNTVRWIIGFQTSNNTALWTSSLPIVSQDPTVPSGDSFGATPVAFLGESVFFVGTGFALERPNYPSPS